MSEQRERLIELMAKAIWEEEGIDGGTVTRAREQARAALDAMEAAGVRIVPAEADEAMTEAGSLCLDDIRSNLDSAYAAMVSNSPYAPEE